MSQSAVSVLDENNGERMVPETAGTATFWEHVYRYAFACRYARKKRVLDIACGEGYGAAAIQKAGAAHVIGVDISESACLHASRKYGIEAKQGTAENIPLADGSIDLVVSFETIEHVRKPEKFLDECVRVLGKRGRVVVSTPNKEIYSGGASTNPHHCSEMTRMEFGDALQSRFKDIIYYTQHPYSAGWWSIRSLAADCPDWDKTRLLRRLRRSSRFRLSSFTMREPTDDERASAVELICARKESVCDFANPYIVRRERSWTDEMATYLIAVAEC